MYHLSHCVKDLLCELRRREPAPSLERPVKTFLKSHDIPVLELRQLSGVDGTGRLTVFLSQIESCSRETEERQQIVQMRVDAPLALFIQSILNREAMSWEKFKEHLTTELTDQSEERIFDSLSDLKYTCDEDPVEFVTKLKCKLTLLEVQTKSGEVPKTDQLIKKLIIERYAERK